MPKLQGVIFDLDGTLVDSAPDLRQALNQVLAARNRRAVTLDEMKSFTGDGMVKQLQRAFAATGDSLSENEAELLFRDFIAYYRGQKPDPAQIYPHVVETLDALKADGVKLGVCTNKQEAATLRLLNELDLTRYFGCIAGCDTFAVHKPHPGHVRGVIETLQVPAEGCVMIGDSINDVLAAKGAGIPCLVVTHGYGADPGDLGADGLIGGFRDLRAALAAFFRP
jgi:phosphoglycolate phosphatase